MENMNKNIAYEHIDFSEITKVRFLYFGGKMQLYT